MKVLVAVYTVLAVAAGSRAVVQLAGGPGDALVPYLLSAAAAGVYLVLAVALRRTSEAARRVALVAASVELAGVVTVGLAEAAGLVDWPDQTVWSGFGMGYGFAPLVLPVAALVVLARHRDDVTPAPSARTATGAAVQLDPR